MFTDAQIARLARVASALVAGEGDGHTEYARGAERRRYVVGGYAPALILPTGSPRGVIRERVRRMVERHGAGAATLGCWEDDGAVYVDLGVMVHDLDVALSLAGQLGELAIFDREKGQSVYL